MNWVRCSADGSFGRVTLTRFGHTAVLVDAREVWGTELIVVFGGVSYGVGGADSLEQQTAVDEVLVLHTENETWFTPQIALGPALSPRVFHCAAAVGRKMYVFGGHVLSFDEDYNKKRRIFFNDLWCLDTESWQWYKYALNDADSPGKRDMATLTYVGNNCLLLFGGRNEAGRTVGDMWLFDITRATWSVLKTPAPQPAPRKMHSAVSVNNRLLLLGGERDTGVLDDLWSLKGLDGSEPLRWTQIKLRPAPQARFGHAMAVSGRRVYVWGGCLDQTSLFALAKNYVQCRELWVLDLTSFSWLKLESEGIEGVAPLERMCHSLTACSANRLISIGGRRRDGICEDSWWLNLDADTPEGPSPDDAQKQAAAAGHSPEAAANQRPQSQQAPPPPPPAPSPASSTLLQTLFQPLIGGVSIPPPPPPPGPPASVPSVAAGRGAVTNQTADGGAMGAFSTITSMLEQLDDKPGVIPPLSQLSQLMPGSRPAMTPALQQASSSGRGRGGRGKGASEEGALGKYASVDFGTALALEAAEHAAQMEELRVMKLGLPLLPPQHLHTSTSGQQPHPEHPQQQRAGPPHHISPQGSAQAQFGGGTSRAAADQELIELGRQLFELQRHQTRHQQQLAGQQPDSGGAGHQEPSRDDCLAAARQYFSQVSADDVALQHLAPLLTDYRNLAAAGWAKALAKAARAAGQQPPAAVAKKSESLTGSVLIALSRQPGRYYHSSAEELRLADVPVLLNEYRQLMQQVTPAVTVGFD